MSEHTKGRLSVVDARVYYENCQGGFDLRKGPNAEANARRLAACWNACIGLSTEDLESLPCAFSEVAVGNWMHNEKEIAAARALLREVLEEDGASMDTEARIQSYLDACHALGGA